MRDFNYFFTPKSHSYYIVVSFYCAVPGSTIINAFLCILLHPLFSLSFSQSIQPDSTIRKLTFNEFWEALVRCSLVAYSKISDATIIDKIRGLFLYMWRAINKSVPRAFNERKNVSTYAGDLLSGK